MRSITFIALFVSYLFKNGTCKFDPFIVGGQEADIKNYPHSAFIAVSCEKGSEVSNWACGSSILNEVLLLTAAHCLENCLPSSFIGIRVGNKHKRKGVQFCASQFISHPHYDSRSVSYDIAMIKVKDPLKLGAVAKRVAVVRSLPVSNEDAYVAGWGLVDETNHIGTTLLKMAKQKIYSYKRCVNIMKRIPEGALCAGVPNAGNANKGHASIGDSGSALMVRGFIQLGIVSYKNPVISKSVVVYTNTSYFYDWIMSAANKLYCRG